MPEMNLRQTGFTYSFSAPSKEYKHLKKQEIH